MIAALVLAATLSAPLAGASPTTFARQEQDSGEESKMEAWPRPADAKALEKDVQRLRKARTEEMGEQAAVALRAVGDAAAPWLLEALGKEKDEDAQERIRGVLTAILGPRHTRLLAKELEQDSDRVRTFCYLRIAAFPDAALADAIVGRLDALKKAKKVDPDELYAAALCALSTGRIVGLDVVFGVAKESWARHSEEIRVAAGQVRGVVATDVLAAHLTGSREERVTALRLLASCGDREKSIPLLRPLLDDGDNTIRIATINALRGIVDGDPPIEKLPVFEAIEMAREWKNRLG